MKDLDKILEEFLKKCSFLVGAMIRLERLQMSREQISNEFIMDFKRQKVDEDHKQEKVEN